MTRRPRKSPRQRNRGAKSTAIRQLPFKVHRNPFRPVEILSEDQIHLIHEKSLDLLQDYGIEFLLDEAREMLAAAGADVEPSGPRVRFDRGMIEERIKTVPRSFKLHARNPAHDLEFGDNTITFIMVGSAPNASDIEGGRRPGNFSDYCDFLKLSQSLNICNGPQGYPTEPTDIPTPIRHLEAGRAMVKLTDKANFGYALGRQRLADVLEIVRIGRGISAEQLSREPSMVATINCNSPLRYDTHLTQGLIELARHNQPTVVSPFTLSGAMAPVTLAGTLIQQNAEALAAIALTQVANPGAPVFYGAFASNVDMRSGAPAFGTPEYVRTTLAAGQLARHYGFPYRSSAPCSANAPDAQAVYETEMALWPCLLGHANMVKHAFGWLEGGLCASFEKVIIDAEIVQNLVEVLHPIDTSPDALGIEAIKDVGPGGHFFGTQHTLERYETAFYEPFLSDRRNFESWEEAGSPDTLTRAHKIYKSLIADYEPPALDPAIAEELDAFVDRRIAEGGAEYGT